jgi:L-threonylcarbamoyladenylate synthase
MERWPADRAHLIRAAERLRQGEVIAFPTDTVYGVGVRAGDPAAVARLYAVKRRRSDQPMVWLVRDGRQVEAFARISTKAADLMRRFWPGPLTLVLPARDPGAPSIAFRAPNNDAAQALLEVLGEPIASSSANPAGQPPPTDAHQVIASLGDALSIVLDGGPCRIGEPSTILDLSGTTPRILRQGALPASQLMPS